MGTGDIDVKVGDAVKALCGERSPRITQGQLAAQSGISLRQLQRYLNGASPWTLDAVVRVAGVLNVDPVAVLIRAGVSDPVLDTLSLIAQDARHRPIARRTIIDMVLQSLDRPDTGAEQRASSPDDVFERGGPVA
ncbi:MAG: helix-turn-helix domain-containing protein [Acidimicrobiales bacterium]